MNEQEFVPFCVGFQCRCHPNGYFSMNLTKCAPLFADEFQNRIWNVSNCGCVSTIFSPSFCTFNRKTFIGKLYSLVTRFFTSFRGILSSTSELKYICLVCFFSSRQLYTTCKHFPFKLSEKKKKNAHARIALPDHRFRGFLKINQG